MCATLDGKLSGGIVAGRATNFAGLNFGFAHI
jgi:hypothetical protein